MKIEEQVTSLELSKQLKEAGYKQEGLFYWSVMYYGLSSQRAVLLNKKQEDWQGDIASRKCYVAPTVAELGEALPNGCRSYLYGKTWYCNNNAETTRPRTILLEADTEANARVKMWLYLKKENKL